jgi:hypothetical protein
MRYVVKNECGMARKSPIPWFAKKPSHPSVPLADPSAVARSGGQGRPQAGAWHPPLTDASTMARSRHGGDEAGSRFTRHLLAGLLAIAVPSLVMPAQAGSTQRQPASDPYAPHVTEAARRFGIPAAWIRAVMHVESRGDRRAVSAKGAMGLMQLMPETWAALRARYGLGRNPFDLRDNILAGAAYLREMHDLYGSPGFLAAYNAGPGRYEDYRDRRRPLPAETIAYVTMLAPAIGERSLDGGAYIDVSPARSRNDAGLFVVGGKARSDAVRPTMDMPPRRTMSSNAVADLTAITPQATGLFVTLSTAGRTP